MVVFLSFLPSYPEVKAQIFSVDKVAKHQTLLHFIIIVLFSRLSDLSLFSLNCFLSLLLDKNLYVIKIAKKLRVENIFLNFYSNMTRDDAG
jgi:hypothetical protein